jgi:hypothetical protein
MLVAQRFGGLHLVAMTARHREVGDLPRYVDRDGVSKMLREWRCHLVEDEFINHLWNIHEGLSISISGTDHRRPRTID